MQERVVVHPGLGSAGTLSYHNWTLGVPGWQTVWQAPGCQATWQNA
jgi:hypothetical protein